MIFNVTMSIMLAVSAGGFYFAKDENFLAAMTLVAAILFAFGYFDINEHEKSAK